MFKKGQLRDVEKGDSMKQMACIASLLRVAVSAEQERGISRPQYSPQILQHNR